MRVIDSDGSFKPTKITCKAGSPFKTGWSTAVFIVHQEIKQENRGVHKGGLPQNGWFIVDNLIEIDDLGYPSVGNLRIENSSEFAKKHGD